MYDSLDDLAADTIAAATLSDSDRWLASSALDAGEPALALADAVCLTSKALPADLIAEIREDVDDGLFDLWPSVDEGVRAALDSMQVPAPA